MTAPAAVLRPPRQEASLADYLPLWRTLQQPGLGAVIVTPALDYVGAVELIPVDARYASEEAVAGVGEALRAFVGGTDDDCVLHFLYRVGFDDAEAEVSRYVEAHRPATGELARFVASRAEWLRGQELRTVRLFLFFSAPNAATSRIPLGTAPQRFLASPAKLAAAAHDARLKALVSLRTSLTIRLAQLGLGVQELSVHDTQRLYYQLLNPARPPGQPRHPIQVRADLWSPRAVTLEGTHLQEYTEAEQLLVDDVEEFRTHLRFGGERGVYRRALTLKTLPEHGTSYFAITPLLELRPSEGTHLAGFAYWVAVVVRVKRQGFARFLLDKQHGLVDILRTAVPFLDSHSVAQRTDDAAKQGGIAHLFAELAAMASKLVSLSVTLLLDAHSLEELDVRTQVARSAAAASGNSELLLEEASQLPAFLSVLPGAGAFQLRAKTCTSRNAGDYLPVVAPWQGSRRPVSLLTSPQGDVFRFDPLDRTLSPSHHALVVADTGSGKSVSVASLVLDALAAGTDAILVDRGGSWEPLTRVLGGVHLPVDITTPITPFRPWADMLDKAKSKPGAEVLDLEAIEDVVLFLELCVTEEGERGFDKLATGLVARAVRRVYEGHFRLQPTARPLMSDFRRAIGELGAEATHPDDRRICEALHRGLGLFVGDELYGTFLDRPSALRFDAPLLTFDMAGASRGRFTRTIALATVMQAITARAAARLRPAIVAIDESHSHLAHATAARFLDSAYREMRKYGVAMWMLSQLFADFLAAKAAPAIVANSTLKFFLRHRSGHQAVAGHFGFTPRQTAAFHGLSMRAGHYSDMLLLYGERSATLRLALHPLAYWLFTTDALDKELLRAAQAKNAHLSQLALLEQLAARYPHGAPR